MVSISAKPVSVVAGVLAGLGVAGWLVLAREAPPDVDPAVAAAVLPVIDDELERGPWAGMLSSTRPESRPRWFCAERVIEIRRTRDEVTVGLEASCDEFARDGDVLVEGSGERAPKLVVLRDGSRRVIRVETAPDGDALAPWVRRHFSAAGAAELDRRNPIVDTNIAEARRTFGLPSDAPVRPG